MSAVEQRTGHRERLATAGRRAELGVALNYLRPSAPPANDEPVFILAAGWRSGSTLLQRLVMSAGGTLVWGEPWNRCDYVVRLADSLRPINEEWPFEHTLFPDNVEDTHLQRTWVANLFPAHADLIEAHRVFFRRLFADPARELGYARWGAKVVRLGIDEAMYLRLLFPRARILLLYRNPYDAWASYKATRYRAYREWPRRPIDTVAEFAENWRDLAEGFVHGHEQVGAMLLRYEDLIGEPQCYRRLQAYLGMELATDVFSQPIGATEKQPLTTYEKRRINAIAGSLAGRLGY